MIFVSANLDETSKAFLLDTDSLKDLLFLRVYTITCVRVLQDCDEDCLKEHPTIMGMAMLSNIR